MSKMQEMFIFMVVMTIVFAAYAFGVIPLRLNDGVSVKYIGGHGDDGKFMKTIMQYASDFENGVNISTQELGVDYIDVDYTLDGKLYSFVGSGNVKLAHDDPDIEYNIYSATLESVDGTTADVTQKIWRYAGPKCNFYGHPLKLRWIFPEITDKHVIINDTFTINVKTGDIVNAEDFETVGMSDDHGSDESSLSVEECEVSIEDMLQKIIIKE